MGNSRHTASIHILDDDSLLHVFYLYRPFLLGEDEDADARLWGGTRLWVRGRWWYRLAHVCKRWRNVILGSASHLGLSLVCTYGTRVAEMLEHSPPLPLVIDYPRDDCDITAEEEEGIIFALKQRHRVLRIRLRTPVSSLQKFIAAMDEEYPVLEHLVIVLRDNSTILIFPESFQAPHFCHLTLQGFAFPIGSRLLTTAVGLVSLYLVMVHTSTYFHPHTLLQSISLMSQLEILAMYFKFSTLNHDVERQLTNTPVIAPITLPNLRRVEFRGLSAYLEALVLPIIAPRLHKVEIEFFSQLAFSVPCLLQFINAAENVTFGLAAFTFYDKKVNVSVYPHGETKVYALSITVNCDHLDRGVSSMAQISNSIRQIFSAVEYVALQYRARSEEHNEIDCAEWHKILRLFSNVKTLRIDSGLVKDLSRCLELKDEELPLNLLPKLQNLTYGRRGNSRDGAAFTSFVDARQNAGRPVTLVRLKPTFFGGIR